MLLVPYETEGSSHSRENYQVSVVSFFKTNEIINSIHVFFPPLLDIFKTLPFFKLEKSIINTLA